MTMKILSYEFNMNTAWVELRLADGADGAELSLDFGTQIW